MPTHTEQIFQAIRDNHPKKLSQLLAKCTTKMKTDLLLSIDPETQLNPLQMAVICEHSKILRILMEACPPEKRQQILRHHRHNRPSLSELIILAKPELSNAWCKTLLRWQDAKLIESILLDTTTRLSFAHACIAKNKPKLFAALWKKCSPEVKSQLCYNQHSASFKFHGNLLDISLRHEHKGMINYLLKSCSPEDKAQLIRKETIETAFPPHLTSEKKQACAMALLNAQPDLIDTLSTPLKKTLLNASLSQKHIHLFKKLLTHVSSPQISLWLKDTSPNPITYMVLHNQIHFLTPVLRYISQYYDKRLIPREALQTAMHQDHISHIAFLLHYFPRKKLKTFPAADKKKMYQLLSSHQGQSLIKQACQKGLTYFLTHALSMIEDEDLPHLLTPNDPKKSMLYQLLQQPYSPYKTKILTQLLKDGGTAQLMQEGVILSCLDVGDFASFEQCIQSCEHYDASLFNPTIVRTMIALDMMESWQHFLQCNAHAHQEKTLTDQIIHPSFGGDNILAFCLKEQKNDMLISLLNHDDKQWQRLCLDHSGSLCNKSLIHQNYTVFKWCLSHQDTSFAEKFLSQCKPGQIQRLCQKKEHQAFIKKMSKKPFFIQYCQQFNIDIPSPSGVQRQTESSRAMLKHLRAQKPKKPVKKTAPLSSDTDLSSSNSELPSPRSI